jgi:outer membrane protein assembly factor BamE
MMRRALIRNLAVAALAAGLAPGCGFVPRIPGITPYRIDIQQGNYISQEMVSQLKTGMTKEQVRFILGTPMVTDIFHSDRWDYVYWRETPKGSRERRNLTVLFEEGQLARIDGDAVPSGGQTR